METITIALGTKADPITVNLADIMGNSAALRYVVEYGLKQSLNDAIAAVKTTDTDYSREATGAIAAKRLDAILSGTVRQPGTREASDPVGVEAKKLAREAFNKKPEAVRAAAIRAVEATQPDIKTAAAVAIIVAAMAKTDAWRAAAEESIAARAKAVANVDAELDLAALGLTD